MLMENVKRVGMLFITLITLIIVASIIFIVNINLKDESKEKLNEDSSSLSDKEIASLLELVNVYDSYIITFDGTKDLSTLTDKEKINFIDRLPIEIKNDLDLDFNNGVSLNRVENVLKKYFGPKTTFNPVNSTCFLDDGDYLIYDSITNMYKADTDYHAHSAYTPLSIENYYVEGERRVERDRLIYSITFKKAFAYPNTSSYFSNYTDLVNNRNLVVDLYNKYNDYETSDINSLIEPFKDELTSYTYIFETKDSINNSYLVELVNLNSHSQLVL